MKQIKISLLALAAIIVGAAASAFTAPSTSPTANSFFEFDYAHYSPTLANVQDESKWIKVTDLSGCDNSPVRACRIEVAPTYVSGTTLLSTANIGATQSSPGISYVTSGNIVNIMNRN